MSSCGNAISAHMVVENIVGHGSKELRRSLFTCITECRAPHACWQMSSESSAGRNQAQHSLSCSTGLHHGTGTS